MSPLEDDDTGSEWLVKTYHLPKITTNEQIPDLQTRKHQ